jgi:hypothetical protein
VSPSPENEPWRDLPAEVAGLIRPELPGASDAILEAIRREVPEYARPLEGSFGRGIRRGVSEALEQFTELIGAGEGEGGSDLVYRELGRGEVRQGRTLDSLQAAYRVGARVAWRRLARVAQEEGMDPATLSLLAEAIFAYIDRLAAASVEGYAEEMAAREDQRGRRRAELAELLIARPPASRARLEDAAAAAGWPLPRRVAALAFAADDLEALRRALPADALVAAAGGRGCALVPDPEGPGRLDQLARAARGRRCALGPAEEPAGCGRSWALAALTLETRGEEGLARAEDSLADLLLAEAADSVTVARRRRLAPFAGLTAAARERLARTALAYVQNGGNAAAIARELQIHPQTARHRIRRLRDLLGEQLDQPAARLELEVALRAALTE